MTRLSYGEIGKMDGGGDSLAPEIRASWNH